MESNLGSLVEAKKLLTSNLRIPYRPFNRPGGSGETGETSASQPFSKLQDFPSFPSEIQLISTFSLPTFTVVPPALSFYVGPYWRYFFVAGVIRAGVRDLNLIRAGQKMEEH